MTTYPMTSRVTDIALEGSVVTETLGPRIFSAEEALLLMEEVQRVEGFLTLLSDWVSQHRALAAGIGGLSADFVHLHCLAYTPGADLYVGQLKITNCTLKTFRSATIPVDATVGVLGVFQVSLAGTNLAELNLNTYALHAFLRALPQVVYHGMGSMLEEVASTYYKGTAPSGAITNVERAALVRLQDKIVKADCEISAQTQLSALDGNISGVHAYAGMVTARANAMALISALSPNIAAWLFDADPLGVKGYNSAGAA